MAATNHDFIDPGDTEELLSTYFDVGWCHSEMDWLKQKVEDLQAETIKIYRKWVDAERMIMKLTNDNQSQLLAETLGENDRLKYKVNKLLERIK
jgi:hypothetical protein